MASYIKFQICDLYPPEFGFFLNQNSTSAKKNEFIRFNIDYKFQLMIFAFLPWTLEAPVSATIQQSLNWLIRKKGNELCRGTLIVTWWPPADPFCTCARACKTGKRNDSLWPCDSRKTIKKIWRAFDTETKALTDKKKNELTSPQFDRRWLTMETHWP